MSRVFATQSPANKVALVKGQKLGDVIGSATLEDVGLYNWGTKDPVEINRALVELVGCQKVNVDPLQSELDPALGTGGSIYRPEPWKAEGPLDIGKTHTFKVKKRLPMPAVAITELTRWFKPNSPEKCTMKYRLEGLAVRADKTDLEIHVARYRDRQGKVESSYYEIKNVPRDGEGTTSGPDNPMERNEVASGTDGPEDTHIWRDHADGVAPSVVTFQWGGESKAAKGILKPMGGKKYINSASAPYSVLIRYYKNDADKSAAILFKESFYPKWKVLSGGTRKLDLASLVVRWTVTQGPKKKLVLGQLHVIDKSGAVVRCFALDEAKLLRGELDLAPLWPEGEVKRDEMPYRVQIQAHSGPDEPEGLALAVMPTQVRAYDYKQVQYLAFNVRPPSPYMGDPNHDIDIKYRCDTMIDAVRAVAANSDAATDILKIFMAPEFYFRGPEGAYPVEKIETIMPLLREESDKFEYTDWMFVFGSAIGYQKHEDKDTSAEIEHKAWPYEVTLSAITATEVTATRVKPKQVLLPQIGWRIMQGPVRATITKVVEVTKHAEYKLTFGAGSTFNAAAGVVEVPRLAVLETDPPMSPAVTRIRVKDGVCKRIPAGTVGGTRWNAKQGLVESLVTAAAPLVPMSDEFWLTLQTPGAFTVGEEVALVEPIATEVTNVALVQKGYPSPYMGDLGLWHVGIYKEKVSPIDFFRATTDWHAADGTGRLVTIHGTPDRPVLPTAGAVDLGGASPNTGSEINKSGIGGGVVFTMDDITFGLEVCLDHGEKRLAKFYAPGGAKMPGDPKVQLHLIPSWGMDITAGAICCPSPAGSVFNVDGSRRNSAVRIYDGTWSCTHHPNEVGAQGSQCTSVQRHYYCATCACEPPGKNCRVHPGALQRFYKCGASKYFNGGTPLYVCLSCKNWQDVGTPCGCLNPTPHLVQCGKYFTGSSCTCGNSDRRCNTYLTMLGRGVPPNDPPTTVARARDAKYFQLGGTVAAYPPKDIPPPDIVV